MTQTPSTAVTGTVTVGDSLNIRSGAGTGYPAVGSYANGTRVTILEQQMVGTTRWGRTDRGWISMDYILLEEDKTETLPVLTLLVISCETLLFQYPQIPPI